MPEKNSNKDVVFGTDFALKISSTRDILLLQ
jgi:hypothetical protein